MFPPSLLAAHSPEYRKLRSEYSALDLKINQLAHRGIDPEDHTKIISDPKQRGDLLRSLKEERQRIDNRLHSLKSRITNEIIMISHQQRGRR